MKRKEKLVPIIKLEKKNNRFAYLLLPKIGKLKIRLHREIDWTRAKTGEPSGNWYVCISVEVDLDQILKEAEKRVERKKGKNNRNRLRSETSCSNQ